MSRFAPNEIISLVDNNPRFDLGGSYGPNLVLDELLDEHTMAELGRTALGYRSAPGDAELRAVVAQINGVTADDVVLTIGGMHALFLLAFVLCERGDEAVVTTPIFPPARGVLDAIGATVRALALSFDRGYRLDPNELGSLLTQKTKLVCLASPQNPSGVAIPFEVLAEIVALMRERAPDAYLLVDDEYREAAYGDDLVARSALALGPRVVTAASLSKCHGAPGLRLGWAITQDPAIREQLVRGKFNTVVSAPAIEELLALRVLALRERILGERRSILAACLEKTQHFVERNAESIEWVRPDAGAICCIRLRRDRFDDAAIERFYASLPKHGIRISNGTWFGEEARVFRVGFAHLELPELDAAYDVLSDALNEVLYAHRP
jgi:aspartate/methionine/tyrosine aminotransferase